jgi:hypothetical protein
MPAPAASKRLKVLRTRRVSDERTSFFGFFFFISSPFRSQAYTYRVRKASVPLTRSIGTRTWTRARRENDGNGPTNEAKA